jgi:hypothetical protein
MLSPSPGVITPSATAAATAAIAAAMSAGASIGRQGEMDSALAAGRQDAFDAQFQRRRVAGERQFDRFACQRLGFAVEQ